MSTTTTTASATAADAHPRNDFSGKDQELPSVAWKNSFHDWFKHAWFGSYSNEQVEHNLLSLLPFYPKSDGKRIAKVINTDIGDGKFIHEFYIENTEKPVKGKSPETLDVVLVHGYAASLGLFIDNFDSLSSVPGIKIHAIDLLGFGFSARPTFPHYSSDTKEDVYKTEDWFVDSIEAWRKKRNISKFVLMGHSFGGYLSCVYALKYNQKIIDASGTASNLIDKLVLISPVGLERNKHSLLKDSIVSGQAISKQERDHQNDEGASSITASIPSGTQIDNAFKDQESIVEGSTDFESSPLEELTAKFAETKRGKFMKYLWDRNSSVFTIVRNMGPARSKFISGWTGRRFSHMYLRDPQEFEYIHNYIYRVFNAKGSGEYALTRILAFVALPKLPLLDRVPEKFVKMGLPTLWLYGDTDWMDEKAGLQMEKEINILSERESHKKLASYAIIPHAGHHLYLDNPKSFTKEIFSFIGAST